MKKLYALFSLLCFASVLLAQTSGSLSDLLRNATMINEDEFVISYNSYGNDFDGDGESDQWQEGFDLLEDVVYNATRRPWTPEIGETFMFSIKGTANFTGEMRFYIVDQRSIAGYWSEMCSGSAGYKVVAGKPFEYTVSSIINNTAICTNVDSGNYGEEVLGGLYGELVIGCFPEITSSMAGFDDYPCILYDAELKILYQKAVTYIDPLPLSFDKVMDDAFGYVGDKEYNSTSRVESDDYVNVVLSAVAEDDIDTLLYEFVDVAEDATPVSYNSSVTDLVTIATGIKKGDAIELSFSIPISHISESATPKYKNRFRAYDATAAVNLCLSNVSVTTTVGAKEYNDIVQAVDKSYLIQLIENAYSVYDKLENGDIQIGWGKRQISPLINNEFLSAWMDAGDIQYDESVSQCEVDAAADRLYNAIVAMTTFTISVSVNNELYGSVIGGGQYEEGQMATLEAIPNDGYVFSEWDDGNTQNPRTITVSGNATYTANFKVEQSSLENKYTVSLFSNNNSYGTVTGAGDYAEGSSAILVAMPTSGYEFEQWNDGNTQNPRIITVTENISFIANFRGIQTNYYTITLSPNNNEFGSVMGNGEYAKGEKATLIAIPASGYMFVQWNDGNTSNPREITVTTNVQYIASFEKAIFVGSDYRVTTISSNKEQGTVIGGGSYSPLSTVTLAAVPVKGYQFVQWNDGNTDNPRVITVTENCFYVATFEKISTDISDVENAMTIIINRQIVVNGEAPAFVYTISGQKIANKNLKSGVYFAVVDGKSVKAVVK